MKLKKIIEVELNHHIHY